MEESVAIREELDCHQDQGTDICNLVRGNCTTNAEQAEEERNMCWVHDADWDPNSEHSAMDPLKEPCRSSQKMTDQGHDVGWNDQKDV